MRFLVVGDIHGDIAAIELAFKLALKHSVDKILQVGDFGYFPRIPSYRRFLRVCSRLAQTTGISIIFIDGNHEDHYALPHNVVVSSFHEVLPGVFWASRGLHFVFEATHFVFLGGAYSIDSNSRVVGATVFPDLECIRYKDIASTLSASTCDILICHDAPTTIDFHLKHLYSAGEANRRILDSIISTLTPKVVLHGHYHMYHDTTVGASRIIGLGFDRKILDLFGLLLIQDNTILFTKLDIADEFDLISNCLERRLFVSCGIPDDLAGLDAPL